MFRSDFQASYQVAIFQASVFKYSIFKANNFRRSVLDSLAKGFRELGWVQAWFFRRFFSSVHSLASVLLWQHFVIVHSRSSLDFLCGFGAMGYYY